MKTVLLACYEAWPPTSGAASVTYNLARFLSGERALIQLVPSEGFQGGLDGLEIESLSVGGASGLRRTLRVLGLMRKAAERIAARRPDLVIIEGASWSAYFYVLLKRMRSRGALRGVPVVYHAHNVEYLLRRSTRGGLVARVTRMAERYVVRRADLVTACSEVDAGHFKDLYGIRAVVLPNGVDADLFGRAGEADAAAARRRLAADGPLVTFLGLTTYPPNRFAVDFLVGSVMPIVRREMGDVRLAVVGGPVGHRAEWLIVPGTVPFNDIPGILKASDVCAAPVFSGSGTRLKILEYMAAARPVVSTAKGAEGLAVTDGRDIVLAETAQATAERIIGLLRDRDRAERIGRAGRDLVAARYDWRVLVRDFEKDLEDIADFGASERREG